MTLSGNIVKNHIQKADGTTLSQPYRELEYNANNKPIKITNNAGLVTDLSITALTGCVTSRSKTKSTDPTKEVTIHYIGGGSFEVEIDPESNTKETRAYIGSYAVVQPLHRQRPNSTSGCDTDKPFGLKYLHRDRLGSVDTITDGYTLAEFATLPAMAIEQRSYDIFGKARTTSGGIITDGKLSSDITPRGFTDHEHLDQSGLVHMNGRVYDPSVGRFLSVDPFIAMPDNGQSINPYSYVMNNPLKFTDPSGYTSQVTMFEISEAQIPDVSLT